MLDQPRPRHLPAARDFVRKRRPFLTQRANAVATVDSEVESLTGPVTLTETFTISTTATSTSSKISTTTTSSSALTTSTTSASSTRSSSSSLSTTSSIFQSTSTTSQVSATTSESPSASAVVSTTATATESPMSAIGSETPPGSSLSGGAVAAIAIGALILVAAAAILTGRRCMTMRRRKKRATARWLTGFTPPNTEAFTGPEKYSTQQPPMSTVTPSYGNGYAYTTTPNAVSNIVPRADVAGFSAPVTPVASYNNAPTTPGTARSAFISRATVRYTFVPNLPDELTILDGEVLNVLQEYDDGWVLCSNDKGETGMVPLECLGARSGPGSDTWGERFTSSSRRVSSISGRI
ncbi:hypothetical protein C8R42DRAFT_672188 [Lentinula raphanica]|nr:hypothetical protein C8R42DRAFT_672188 [Lentinula raphanica]